MPLQQFSLQVSNPFILEYKEIRQNKEEPRNLDHCSPEHLSSIDELEIEA